MYCISAIKNPQHHHPYTCESFFPKNNLDYRTFLSCGSFILIKLEFGDVGFCGGRKKQRINWEKNPWGKVRTNNELAPHMALSWNQKQAALGGGGGGGKRSHHCTIPYPHKQILDNLHSRDTKYRILKTPLDVGILTLLCTSHNYHFNF